jgi:hypothetical protein
MLKENPYDPTKVTIIDIIIIDRNIGVIFQFDLILILDLDFVLGKVDSFLLSLKSKDLKHFYLKKDL